MNKHFRAFARPLATVLLLFLVATSGLERTAAERSPTTPYPAPLETTSCSWEVEPAVVETATDRVGQGDPYAAFWLAQYYAVCERPDDDEPQLLRQVVDWYALALRAEPQLITSDALWFLSDHFGLFSQVENRDALARAIWQASIEQDSLAVDNFLATSVCAEIPEALEAYDALAKSSTMAAPFASASLGEMYETGRCVLPDRERAISHYQRCALVDSNCDYPLERAYEAQPFSPEEEAFYLTEPFRPDWLAQAARRGSTRALALLEEEARAGTYYAAWHLGTLFHGRDPIEERPLTAATWFEACAVDLSGLCDDALIDVLAGATFADDYPTDFARMAIGVVERGEVLNYPSGVDDIQLLNTVIEVAPTDENKRRIAAIFYDKAATYWRLTGQDRLTLVERALAMHTDPLRWSRAAHTLYIVAHLDPEIREQALIRSAEYFERAGDAIDAIGLTRFAFLQLMESRQYKPDGGVAEALTRSAALGSRAATNTLDWFQTVEHREFPGVQFEAEEGEPDLCSESGDQLPAVLREHFRQARELMELRGGPPPVTARDVSSLIAAIQREGEKAALLIYAQGWDGQCVWLLDSEGVRAFEKVYAPLGSIEADLRRMYEALGIPEDRTNRDAPRGILEPPPLLSDSARRDQIAAAIESLSRLMLPSDIAEQLSHYPSVFVAPFGAVGSTPFSLLKTRGGDYVSDNTGFVILAGLSEIPSRRRGPRLGVAEDGLTATEEIVVLGNPRPAGALADLFPDLSGAEQEAVEVADLFGATAFLRETATTEVLSEGGKRARIMYFAGHAVAAAETPEAALDESYLVTADGVWTAREIQDQTFAAEIAVLSACQTGLGFEHFGGTIGLSRAFIIAGVPQVVMSLWSVNDQATRLLMTEFMGNSREMGYVDALRAAMQTARTTYDDPTFWAGFTFFAASINSLMAHGT